MANMLFANNCNTTLNGGITAVATSMVVTSTTNFPVPTGSQYFYCTLADAATQTTIEIVKVTAVSGTTFTIVRGQDGTTGTAFASGDVISLRLVRANLNDFPKLDEVNTFTANQNITGNLGLNSTLASWGAGYNAVQLGSTGNINFTNYVLSVANNAYYNGSIETTQVAGYQTKYTGNASTGNHVWYTNVNTVSPGNAISWTQAMTLFNSGGVSIGNTTDPGAGNLRFNTTGSNGIYFGSSSLLADYEEGTFTPILNRDSTSPTVTYTTQLGSYVKVGNLVTVNIYLAWSAISGGSGNYTITGLPYTCANSNAYLASSAIGFWAGITLRTLDTQLGAYSAPNTTIMYLSSNPSSNTIVTVTAGAIVLTMSYRAK